MTNPTVRPMVEAERAEVLAVTARAFWFDPLIDYFTRDLLHEYRVLPTVFGAIFKDLAAPLASISVAEHAGRPRGVAGWLEPGAYPRPARQEAARTLRSAAVIARGRNRSKLVRLYLEVEKRHPPRASLVPGRPGDGPDCPGTRHRVGPGGTSARTLRSAGHCGVHRDAEGGQRLLVWPCWLPRRRRDTPAGHAARVVST